MPLAQQVREAAIAALRDLLPIWYETPLSDHRRVYTPNGPGNYVITIEPYRGSYTSMAFHRKAAETPSLAALDAAIQKFQPELRGYLVLPGRTMHLPGAEAFVFCWLQALETTTRRGEDSLSAIEALLSRFSELLDSRRLNQVTTTVFAGLKLPDPSFTLRLDDSLVLRALTSEEIAKLSGQDITFGRDNDIISHAVSSCLVHTFASTFALALQPPQDLLTSQAEEEARLLTISFLRALHVLKPGKVAVFQVSSELTPLLLPWLSLGTQSPLLRTPFTSMELTADEVEPFLQLLTSIQAGPRAEVQIAADRLVDAESRLSPVDALMDAAIGLETLLNPVDSSELAFRVALNYAFLGSAEFRRDRYDRVRALQKVRNRVVHGGLNLHSPDGTIIHEQSTLARACLRDAVKSFLLDPTLLGNRKLDADFWLDRILPATILGTLPFVAGHHEA